MKGTEQQQQEWRDRVTQEIGPITADVLKERFRQIGKFGDGDHNHDKYTRILMEEVGEACQEIEKIDTSSRPAETWMFLAQLRAELVQVAAVTVRWIQTVDRELARVQTEVEKGPPTAAHAALTKQTKHNGESQTVKILFAVIVMLLTFALFPFLMGDE